VKPVTVLLLNQMQI